MMKIYTAHHLKQIQALPFLMEEVERGFVFYSQGKVQMPSACHMRFDSPPGDVHIKCASIQGEEFYVVKTASHFSNNIRAGLAAIQGMIALYSQQTGELKALFLDQGYLTHLRTALAGAICAKYLAPASIEAIGIIGAGQQARMQLKCLAEVTSCRRVWIFARNASQALAFQRDPELAQFKIEIATSPSQMAEHCRLIVTTTSSENPLLFAEDVWPGTHITTVGADRPGKQELDPAIFQRAKCIVADSRPQCFAYGEIATALNAELIEKEKVVEIGEVIAGLKAGRTDEKQISVASLTGLGIQDLQVALACWRLLSS